MSEMTTQLRRLAAPTPDGLCPIFLFTPSAGGAWPCVIVYMDGPGVRPTLLRLCERLAASGFAVVLPDLFYRTGPYDPVDPKIVFADPALRQAHRDKHMVHVTSERVVADTGAIMEFIADRSEIRQGPVGVVGYCMGGRLALTVAGHFPDVIAAAASFHGGGLANKNPDSPHLLAPKIKARVFVAGAIEDANFDDAMKARLEQALTNAQVDNQVVTWPARHGWVFEDQPVYDHEAAERHWRELPAFLHASLDSA